MNPLHQNRPEDPAHDAVLDAFSAAAFSAAPQVLDAERVLHAYLQAYKIEGTERNVRPTTAEEKETARQTELQFRAEMFALTGFEGLKACAIFCHHHRIRSSGGPAAVNFLAEIRDDVGRSLIPNSDSSGLVACQKGLVALHVIARPQFAPSLLCIPTYSPRAFQNEVDTCTEIPIDAPLNHLQREIVRAAAICLTNEADTPLFIRDTQAVMAERSANVLLSTSRGNCQVMLKHDAKTLRVSLNAHKVHQHFES